MQKLTRIITAVSLLSASFAMAQATPANIPIDLTQPLATEPLTDSEVFDQSVIFSPNFGINQKDPALKDLFAPNGDSNLCFPASLAEALVDMFQYHAPALDKLQLAGLSNNGKTIEPNALVRQLAGLCKTDAVNGTYSKDALGCINAVFTQAGYAMGDTKLISPFDAGPFVENRQVNLKDIRSALDSGNPVLLEAAWFKFDPVTKTWTHDSGHYISVYGYDYNESWGDNMIQLKVINPEMQYDNSRKFADFDTVTVERFSPQPGIIYPAHRSFVLSGSGFGGSVSRGFLGMIFKLAPKVN